MKAPQFITRLAAVFVAALASVGRALSDAIEGHLWNRGLILGLSNESPIVRNSGTSWAAKFAQQNVVQYGMSEVIRQRYYDRILYPTAGVQQLAFFSLPIGQGVTTALGAVVGAVKTRFDTNCENAGMIPNGKQFLIESIELIFEPGGSAAANTYIAPLAGDFIAAAADTNPAMGYMNDLQTFYASGLFSLNILAKNYLQEFASAFPGKVGIDGFAAISTNSATVGSVSLANARNAGRPYYLDPMLTLQPMVNFQANVDYPAVVATPSGFNGRVTCILDGVLMRAAQ